LNRGRKIEGEGGVWRFGKKREGVPFCESERQTSKKQINKTTQELSGEYNGLGWHRGEGKESS